MLNYFVADTWWTTYCKKNYKIRSCRAMTGFVFVLISLAGKRALFVVKWKTYFVFLFGNQKAMTWTEGQNITWNQGQNRLKWQFFWSLNLLQMFVLVSAISLSRPFFSLVMKYLVCKSKKIIRIDRCFWSILFTGLTAQVAFLYWVTFVYASFS